MPLSAALYEEFDIIPADTTNENAYNGAWNMFLVEYFPLRDGWVVAPQARPSLENKEAVDYGIYYKAGRQRMPAMFVKPMSSLASPSVRAKADQQMRERFVEFFDSTPSIMFGLSAFGPRICLYTLDKETRENMILPHGIENSPLFVRDTAPLNRWNIDLMTDAGYDETMAFSNRVKQVMEREGQVQVLANPVVIHFPKVKFI